MRFQGRSRGGIPVQVLLTYSSPARMGQPRIYSLILHIHKQWFAGFLGCMDQPGPLVWVVNAGHLGIWFSWEQNNRSICYKFMDSIWRRPLSLFQIHVSNLVEVSQIIPSINYPLLLRIKIKNGNYPRRRGFNGSTGVIGFAEYNIVNMC